MERNEEVVCSIGPSYLILRSERPNESIQNGIPWQDVLFYFTLDSDEVSHFSQTIAPLPCPSYLNLKQASINSRRWLLQPIEDPSNSQEWIQKLTHIFQLCSSNGVFRIVMVRPSAGLCNQFPTIGVTQIVKVLEMRQRESPLRVTLVMQGKMFEAVKATLAREGLCMSMGDTVQMREVSLLEQAINVLRCNVCRRLAYHPVITTGEGAIICKMCLLELGLENPQFSFEADLAAKLLFEVKVVCRCGVEMRANELDVHAMECKDKEVFCNQHQASLRGEAIFQHLLEYHGNFVREKAPVYLNRD